MLYPAVDRLPGVDFAFEEGRPLQVGSLAVAPLDEFKQIMTSLDLPYPSSSTMPFRVTGNVGVCPDHLPYELQKYCLSMGQSVQV